MGLTDEIMLSRLINPVACLYHAGETGWLDLFPGEVLYSVVNFYHFLILKMLVYLTRLLYHPQDGIVATTII